MPDPQQFSPDEAERILARAVRQTPSESIDQAQLLRIAAEAGIDQAAVLAAAREIQIERDEADYRQSLKDKRKAKNIKAWTSWLTTTAITAAISLLWIRGTWLLIFMAIYAVVVIAEAIEDAVHARQRDEEKVKAWRQMRAKIEAPDVQEVLSTLGPDLIRDDAKRARKRLQEATGLTKDEAEAAIQQIRDQ